MSDETVTATDETETETGAGSVTRNDSRFRRLQFLFWHKIDRRQRIYILVGLGVLPRGSKIEPIWVWRGLDAARRQGKLKEVWNGIMNQLPDEQQENNLFANPNLTKQK